jgi:hypothetical protein
MWSFSGRQRLLSGAAALLFLCPAQGCDNPDARADVVVYGDHVPQIKNDGTPFVNPFTSRSLPGDPLTTSVMRAVPGLKNPRGTIGWSVASWAKYVFIGNYDHKNSGVFQNIEDQRIGVYDSERKEFCQLDLDPSAATNASVQWIAVANPSAVRTRIFYEGFISGGTGYSFGYVVANQDAQRPCDPSSGWLVGARGFRPADLNAASRAAGQPDACPDGTPNVTTDDGCGFDGMELLHHDEAQQTDTVVLSNWMHNRLIIAQIDGAGNLTIPTVHVLPYYRPDDTCYKLYPVGHVEVDPARPANDRRFLQAFDKICAPNGVPGDAAECPAQALCPLSNTACTTGCADAYCTRPFFGSYVKPPPAGTCKGSPNSCSNYPVGLGPEPICVDLGQATTDCMRVHPNTKCTPNDAHTEAKCSCEAPATPLREYSYDLTTRTLRSTSHFFQGAANENMVVLGRGFSQTGDLFVSTFERYDEGAGERYRSRVLRYPRGADGRRSYNEAATVPLSDGTMRLKNTTSQNYPLKLQNGFGWTNIASAGLEVGNAMYLISKDSAQRDIFGYGTWVHDTSYKLSFGVDDGAPLPQETYSCGDESVRSCAASSDCPSDHECYRTFCRPLAVTSCVDDSECPAGQSCATKRCGGTWNSSERPCGANSDCPSGETCRSGGGSGEVAPSNAALGGAPASLWTTPHYGHGRGEGAAFNAYLNRVPVATDLPGERTTQVPPALAWSSASCPSGKCDRLFLFAAPGGVLSYRTRDRGLWAPAFRPLPSIVPLAGGVAAVFTATDTALNGATIELFARGRNDGRLYTTRLRSALDCAVGACTWDNWTALPGSPTTAHEPSVTIGLRDELPVLFLAVRNSAGQVQWAERTGTTWSAFSTAAGLVSDAAPSVAYKFDDGQVLLFARETGTGDIKYTRIDRTPISAWATAGAGGAVRPWSTAPTAAFTGGRLRLLVGSGSFPSYTYQTTFASGAWDDWKRTTAGAGTTFQPAAAVVNGDLNVVTTYVNNMQEQLVK